MTVRKNYSKKSRKEKEFAYDDYASPDSYDPIKDKNENLNQEEWVKFIDYYREYPDKFATEVLGLKVFLFQKLILRAMARNQWIMLICCRGLGKSWLSAVFFVIMCILHSGLKCGIASGVGQQARNVIIQKVKGELMKNPAIAREITNIKTGAEDCVVEFRNGSEIRAIVLGRTGDSARSWRFHYLLIDEARLVSDKVIEEILIPMTKTKRPTAINHGEFEKGKVIFISSAYLKTSDLYKRFKYFYNKMTEGDANYFVCCLDYKVGIQAKIFDISDIEEERTKPTTTKESFDYEYNAIFVGSSGDSFYPYEITMPCRTLEKCELSQPKKSKSEYVITHDVATSTANDADNAITHVIKKKTRSNGTILKEVVFTQLHRGTTLDKQRDFLRELYHIKFPNTSKIVVDMRGNGEHLPRLFYEAWEYTDPKTGETTEFPPLVMDDDDEGKKLKDAIPLIRGITATNNSNNTMYTYMKACFENESIKLLKPALEVDDQYKSEEMSIDEYVCYIQADELVKELSNIKQIETGFNNIKYERIDKGTKRDRATSLAYGLSVIMEEEQENIRNLNKPKQDDYASYFIYTQ